MHRKPVLAAISALVLVATAGLLTAGPLNPPAGPVAPVYKTLTEVEPRTVVNATNTPGDADSTFKITQPGSYYLAGNLSGQIGKNGIKIESSGVTLDLNGFRLTGLDEAIAAIKISQYSDSITIRNGCITGWPAAGIEASTSSGPMQIENLLVSQISAGPGIEARGPANIVNCTVAYAHGFGIKCQDSGTVSGCAVSYCGDDGITLGSGVAVNNCSSVSNSGEGFSSSGYNVFKGCTASYNTGVGILAGIGSTIIDCSAGANGTEGIRGIGEAQISHCTATANAVGIHVYNGSSVESCTVTGSGTDGIVLGASSNAINNICRGNGVNGVGAGIITSGVASRIDGNNCPDNDYGIRVTAIDNIVVRNTARNNPSGNYSFPNGGEYGQILTNPGSAFTSTNPWANFAF